MNKLILAGVALVAAAVVISINDIKKSLDDYYLDGEWDK